MILSKYSNIVKQSHYNTRILLAQTVRLGNCKLVLKNLVVLK